MAINPEQLLTQKIERPFSYSEKDVLLYHLGIGAKASQLNWVYEENLQVCPSFAVIPGFLPIKELVELDGFNISATQIVHERQKVILHRSLPTSLEGNYELSIEGIKDMRIGASVTIRQALVDNLGELVAENYMTLFVNGEGGIGNHGEVEGGRAPKIKGDLDLDVSVPTSEDQAALYRLSGDVNPLHIDPTFAKKAGFEKPILHGLATLGFAIRTIIDELDDVSVDEVSSMQARFADKVLPGDILQVQAQRRDNNILFRVVLVDDNTVLKDGIIGLN